MSSLHTVVDLLTCPHRSTEAHEPLTFTEDGRSLVCPAGHSFDLARQGYVNLLGRGGGSAGGGDTATMVAARERFLSAGHYRPIAEAVAEVAADALARQPAPRPGPRALVDVGAGSGYYLAHVLERLAQTRGVASDVSVAACRRAARAHPRLGAVVADTWQALPIRDHSMDGVLCVFSPRHPAEFHRMLAPGGVLIVVTPQPGHLAEVREPLGLLGIEAGKQDRLSASVAGLFRPVDHQDILFTVSLERSALVDLVAMGPNAFHATTEQVAERVDTLESSPPFDITAAVSVAVFAAG